MAPVSLTAPESAAEDIKQVPPDAAVRAAIRSAAVELAAPMDRGRPPAREDLERHGQSILARLGLPRHYLGFAMVAVSNEFWRPTLEAMPFHRRLFLLPHCLSDREACRGTYDSIGLHCAGCGSCAIDALRREAEQLGYSVIVAEGTSSVLMKVLEGDADAIFGVACLDSLEKSFHRVVELGIPHMALPLLRNGCVRTEAEVDQIRKILTAETAPSKASPRSYLPLLRESMRMFQPPMFSELLAPYETAVADDAGDDDFLACVPRIALEWLREGGKRLRPFVTIAAYAVARHGAAVLDCGDRTCEKISPAIRRLALAIEALHKASLVHDDIEDDDEFRYGRPTLHRVHGVGQAVNVGDYLIGLGYRLVSGASAELGAQCTVDILDRLSHAHLELCRGQGAELAWQNRPLELHRPIDVLTIYALKTAPAFEVALHAGLRAAGVSVGADTLQRFSTCLGEGFQIRNDLDDWQADDRNKRHRGLDAVAGRPTILRAFAAEGGQAEALMQLAGVSGQLSTEDLAERTREVYHRAGAFVKAEQLLRKLAARAIDRAEEFPSADLRELMRFLVRMVLPDSDPSEARAP